MNRSPRVLLIGRRFWPHGSIDSAGFLYQLACALNRHGVHVEVVTPRYASSWPQEYTIREISVHRPAAAPRSDWSMGRYVRHLTSWLRQQGGSFDVLMVDAIREEAMAAIEAARMLGCPTILRSHGWGNDGDGVWWHSSRSAKKCGAIGKMADAVIAKSAACQRALIVGGYSPSRIERIDNGFAAGPTRSSESRRLARKALGATNGDLTASDNTPVVLCCSRMTRDSGAIQLVKAARHLIARYPDLRLWFVGDGPHRDWMYESLRGDGVRASIAMPGSFCDTGQLLMAADLFLQTDEDGLDYFLPSAISAELPIVTIDNDSTRAVITGSASDSPPITPGEPDRREPEPDGPAPAGLVEWVPDATPKLIRRGIMQVLEDLPARRDKASQLRRCLLRSRPQSRCVQAHVALMEKMISANRSRTRSTSVEAAS